MRVCEVKDSTVFASELHDWLRSLTISREYSYGVSTDKHDSATVALRIRQRPITTTIRHDTPRMFKQFKTIYHGSTTNHHGTPRYTAILQIVATRIATVAKNRECVNRPLPKFATVALRFCHSSSRLIESEPKVHKVSL